MSDKMEIVEQIGGEVGVTVVYTLDEYRHVCVSFFAAEIISTDVPDGRPNYLMKGGTSSLDDTYDVKQAERFIAGTVKWDGCSHIYFGDEDAYLHLCGRDHIDKFAAALKAIHARCAELMTEHGGRVESDAFAGEA